MDDAHLAVGRELGGASAAVVLPSSVKCKFQNPMVVRSARDDGGVAWRQLGQ